MNTVASGHDSLIAHEGWGASEVVSTGHDSKLSETVTCRNSTRAEGDTSKNYLLGYTIIEEVDESTCPSNEKPGLDCTYPHIGALHCYSPAAKGGDKCSDRILLYDAFSYFPCFSTTKLEVFEV